jgi:hypothetical protein
VRDPGHRNRGDEDGNPAEPRATHRHSPKRTSLAL